MYTHRVNTVSVTSICFCALLCLLFANECNTSKSIRLKIGGRESSASLRNQTDHCNGRSLSYWLCIFCPWLPLTFLAAVYDLLIHWMTISQFLCWNFFLTGNIVAFTFETVGKSHFVPYNDLTSSHIYAGIRRNCCVMKNFLKRKK